MQINITEDFDKLVAGVVKISANPKELGGHAICVVAYAGDKKQFKFANSWGSSWGDKGFGYIAENDLKAIMAAAYVLDIAP